VATIVLSLLTAAAAVDWLRRELRIDYSLPLWSVRPHVYRILERARDGIFHGSREVRFTILAPDRNDSEVLRPVLRLGWGRAAANSKSRFRKGEGLAGMAWQNPGVMMVYRLDEFRDESSARLAQREVLHLRPEVAEALSREQLGASVMVAVGLMDAGKWFKGVLCIDSRDQKLIPKHGSQSAMVQIARLATKLAAFLEPPYEPLVLQRNPDWLNDMQQPTEYVASLKEVELSTKAHAGAAAG